MTDTADHWAAGYIGRPWVAGESDCWSFARTVWRERFGLDVPAAHVDPRDPRLSRCAFGVDPAETGWRQITRPCEGDAVLMARGRRPCHVGIWVASLDVEGVLHSVEGSGVIFTPLAALALLGYRVHGFYRRAV